VLRPLAGAAVEFVPAARDSRLLTEKSRSDLTGSGEFVAVVYAAHRNFSLIYLMSQSGGTVAALSQKTRTEDEFSELDQLEVIDSTELKISGAYHSYYYYCAEDEDPFAWPVDESSARTDG
jgi:hypothetical protein